ncbi:MAG: hypothetical protein E2O80_07775 [Betaproteobacteria bacterium]|nr:MAG: hypothetical protein E2O80_07775 [Betaproteobacteria bacterium]
MTIRFPKPSTTVLCRAEADVSAKSLTEEERVRMQTEWAQWAKETLDKILYMVIDNKEIARTRTVNQDRHRSQERFQELILKSLQAQPKLLLITEQIV